jgi:hypothetical protein
MQEQQQQQDQAPGIHRYLLGMLQHKASFL